MKLLDPEWRKLYDKDFREALRKDPKKVFEELGQRDERADDIEFVVKTNTRETLYIVMANPEFGMAHIDYIQAAGAKLSTLASLGSGGTVSSIGSASGTASSFGSASTVGSVGTVTPG